MALEKTLRGIALACLFLVPFVVLIVADSLFFPFITGKNFAFRILIEIAVSAWLALALVYPQYRPKRSWTLYAFAVFVAVIGLADVLGPYAEKSVWSNFERMEGLVTLVHLLLFFVVAASLFTERLWKRWWHTSCVVAVLVAFYALLQLAGLLEITQGSTRLTATLGNATYLGVYMLFHIFVALLLLARRLAERTYSRARVILLYGGFIALFGFVLLFTETRGAILGLLGGLVLAAVIFVVLEPHSQASRSIIAACLVWAVFGVGVFLLRDTAPLRSIGFVERITHISLSEATNLSRLLNVNMAWQGVKERPFLGWGQENYAMVFDKYYDPRMYASEPWFDRVHNVIFDWLIAGGILGLLAYLALFLSGLFLAWRSRAFASYERALLTGLFAGYFFYLLFTFDNITSYILFVAILAWIHVRATHAGVPLWAKPLPKTVLPLFAVLAIVLAWGSAWWVNAEPLAQNRAILKGVSGNISPEARLEVFKQAVSYSSYGLQEAREHVGQAAIAAHNAENVSNEVKQGFLELSVNALMKQTERVPGSARAPFFLGIIFDLYGLHNEAREALEKARVISPRKQIILFQLAQNAFVRGEHDEALAFLREAYELEPSFLEARILYAIALIRSGDLDEADALLAPVSESGGIADARLAGAYASLGRFDKIVSLWTRRVEKNPADIQSRFVLAAALYATGDSDAAIRVLETAMHDAPGATQQAQSMIEEIRSGTLRVR